MEDKDTTTLDDTIDTIDTIDENANPVPATTPANAMVAPPGMKHVDPFVLFRERNSTTGGFLKCDQIKLDHNTGALLRERGNSKTVIEPDQRGQRRYSVNPHLMIERWVKFVDGKLVDQKIYRTAEGELAPTDREEFGLDLDERRWPLKYGERKDPWSREVYLPMKGTDGELVAFKATGKGAIAEIGELVGMYGSANRHGKVPVVDIDSRSFDSTHGSTIHVPVFRLLDWALWDDQPVPAAQPVAVPIAPPATPAAKALPPKRAANDMDDDLPF